jgi:hypothetical protein
MYYIAKILTGSGASGYGMPCIPTFYFQNDRAAAYTHVASA